MDLVLRLSIMLMLAVLPLAAIDTLRFRFYGQARETLWSQLKTELHDMRITRLGMLNEVDDSGRLTLVFVHGTCDWTAAPKAAEDRLPLGWVEIVDGHFLPFVHVNCSRIVKALRRIDDDGDRDLQVARAIGRVVRHELWHLRQQTRHHETEGAFKTSLSARELLEIADAR